jgi:hypothetical protein
MTSFKTFASTLCLAVVCLLDVPEASARELPNQLPKTASSLPVLIMFGLLCLVIGVVLRAFSKPAAELSLNQPTK